VSGDDAADEDGGLPHPVAAKVANIAVGNAIQCFITVITYTGYRAGHGLE
jgi:hypothetical protein